MLSEIKSKKKLTKNRIVVGKLGDDIISFLKKRDVVVNTKDIYLTDKGLSHLMRESKKKRGAGLNEDDIYRLPEMLNKPSSVYFDKGKGRFNILYCKADDSKCIKIAVDTKGYANRGEKLSIIKTAGYVRQDDMKDIIFEKISGKL